MPTTRRQLVLDVVALVAFGALLATIHFLTPEALQGQLGRWGLEQEWTEEERRDVALDAGFAATVVALLVAFVWVLFPASIVQGRSTTNIIAHAAGFGWGVVLPFVEVSL